jgi:uncharacterized protein YeaO (DUF488 family)
VQLYCNFVTVRTRRWSDPIEPGDGLRVLISRYRPRALPKSKETWDAWMPDLGPSRELLAAYQEGKIGWGAYRSRYLAEMKAQAPTIAELGERVREGGTVTLLCSKSCEDEARCHRTPLRALIEARARP